MQSAAAARSSAAEDFAVTQPKDDVGQLQVSRTRVGVSQGSKCSENPNDVLVALNNSNFTFLKKMRMDAILLVWPLLTIP